MTTLYYLRSANKILPWHKIPSNKDISVKSGDPLSIEYKKFRIVSGNFDLFGRSEIAIVNNVKTSQTKDAIPDNIIYYHTHILPKKDPSNKKFIDIDTFDPSHYGNSFCYYTPSYYPNSITIATKFYEISERFGLLDLIVKTLTRTPPIPKYGLYFSLAGEVLQGIDLVLDKLMYKRELTTDHIVKFDPFDIDKPLFYGSYVCLLSSSREHIDDIINNYTLEDSYLTNIHNQNLYPGSYFILELTNTFNKSLLDFDFSHNSNELLFKLDKRDKIGMQEFIQTNLESYNFKIIQDIVLALSHPTPDETLIISLYNKLSPYHQKWSLDTFPNLSSFVYKKF